MRLPQHRRLEHASNATERARVRDVVHHRRSDLVVLVPQNAHDVSLILPDAFRPFVLFQFGEDRGRFADAGRGVTCPAGLINLSSGKNIDGRRFGDLGRQWINIEVIRALFSKKNCLAYSCRLLSAGALHMVQCTIADTVKQIQQRQYWRTTFLYV
jgi:hypothetical protein